MENSVEYDIFIEYTKWWGLIKHCESIEGMTEETFLRVYEDNRPHSEDCTTVKLVDGCIDEIDTAIAFYHNIQHALREAREEKPVQETPSIDYPYRWRGEFVYGREYRRGDVFMYRMDTYIYTGQPWYYHPEGYPPDTDPDCVLMARMGVKEILYMEPVSCSTISEGEAWAPPLVSPFHRVKVGEPGWQEKLNGIYSAEGNLMI